MAKRIRASRFSFNLPEQQYTTQALENYLGGYREYMEKVRYRLLPFVW